MLPRRRGGGGRGGGNRKRRRRVPVPLSTTASTSVRRYEFNGYEFNGYGAIKKAIREYVKTLPI